MALPAGISTATVTVGVPVTFSGGAVRSIVTITPSEFLVHTATGHPLVNMIEEVSTTDGVAAQFTLPVTDQDGFQDENGNAYKNWYYTASIQYVTDKATKPAFTKVFQLVTGQSVVDLDLLPSGNPAIPYTAPIATVTSVNGQTGAIVVEGATDEAVAEQVTSGTQTVAALSATYGPATQAAAPEMRSTYARSGTLNGSWAFLGDSITAGTAAAGAGGFASMTGFLSGQKIRLTLRSGNPGYRSDQILPFVQSAVLPSAARTCFVLVGTNDANQNVTRPVFSANVIQIVDALRAGGVQPVLGTVPPMATKRALIGSYNAWLRVYAAEQGIPIVGIHAALVDSTTGGFAAGYDSGDGIHPTMAGHIAMAQAIVNEVGTLVPPATVPLATDTGDTTNLLLNPLFLTDANVDGLGDSWGNTGTATVTWSTVTDAARWRGKAQKVPITAGAYRRVEQTINAGFAPGDVMAWGCVFAIENLSAGSYGIKFDRVDTGGAAATVVAVGGINANINRGVFWTTWTVPSGTTSFKVRHVADCTGGTTGDFYFAQATLINLTALGLA